MQNIYYKTNQIQQLRGFYYTAKFRSVSLAASFMNLTQPSVSLQIRSLEEELGAELFYRSQNNMVLTSDGEKLLVKASKVVEQVDDIFLNFSNQLKEEENILRVAANYGAMNYILPKLIKKFSKDKKKRIIKIFYATKDKGLKMLSEDVIDIFITPQNFAISREYEYRNLKSYPIYLIAQKNHPLSRKKNITLSDLANYNLTLPPENLRVIPNLREIFMNNNTDIHYSIEFTNWELSKSFVEAGVAISIVPKLVLEKKDDLFTYPMHQYFPDASYGYVITRKRKQNEITQDFIKLLNKTYQEKNSKIK